MKSVIRNDILAKLNSLSRDEKRLGSESIQNNLQKVLHDKGGYWAAFKNLNDEPEIHWDKLSESITWLFPKIKNDSLEFFKSVKTFNKSSLGFAEPSDGIKVNLSEVSGCIMPGLAFDKQGYRLGRGRAFYDRALTGYKGQKIGLCFDVSLCEELPHEEHDIKCDQIITDTKVYDVADKAVGKSAVKSKLSEGVRKWN